MSIATAVFFMMTATGTFFSAKDGNIPFVIFGAAGMISICLSNIGWILKDRGDKNG